MNAMEAMDQESKNVIENLFAKSVDQRTIRSLRKKLENLDPKTRTLLQTEVQNRLKQLLQDEPIYALSLVSLFSDNCSVLQSCLNSCMAEIINCSIDGLEAALINTDSTRFHISSKAVYGAMQSISLEEKTFSRDPVFRSRLQQLFETLVYGVADENLPTDCALILATSLCMVFSFLLKDNLPLKFIQMLKIVENYEKLKDKDVARKYFEQLYKDSGCEIFVSYGKIGISYAVILTIHGLLNSGVSWIYSNVSVGESSQNNVNGTLEDASMDKNQQSMTCEMINQSSDADGSGRLKPSYERERGEKKAYGQCPSPRSDETNEVFLYRLYPVISKFCRSSLSYSFQNFQVLLAWLQSIRRLGRNSLTHPECSSASIKFHPSKLQLFAIPSESSDSVFYLLNSNWESPSKGVSDLVYTCMTEILHIHEDETPGRSKIISMQIVSSLVCANAWNLKSTYPPLALAFSFGGAEQVLEKFPSIPKSLLESLTVNYLAPAGANVYKIILSQLISSVWSKHFLSVIAEALHSPDRMTRQHVLTLWLPVTIKQYPDIYVDLLNICDHYSTEGWLSRMAILKVTRAISDADIIDNVQSGFFIRGRAEKSLDTSEQEIIGDFKGNNGTLRSLSTVLHYAISHIDENVRSEGLALLCHTKKASQPVSLEESKMLKEFFSLNMNIDSAPFRQCIIKCFKALVVRMRDACATVLKNPPYKNSKSGSGELSASAIEDLDCSSVLFVNCNLLVWFILRFHYNLKPGSNYQRRILSLQLYKETLLAFYELDKNFEYTLKQRFSSVSSFVTSFSGNDPIGFDSEVASQPIVDLTLPWTSKMLLSCCLDEMNDIREEAENIFRILESSRVKQSEGEVTKWLLRGLNLCDSPKASEVESGASIVKTLSCKKDFNLGALSKSELFGSHTNLVTYLYERVDTQFQAAQENMLIASRNGPMHGSLLALGRCFCKDGTVATSMSEGTQNLLNKLIELMVNMVEYVFSVLATSSKHGSAIAPSFAEMGESIEMVIKKCEEGQVELNPPNIEVDSPIPRKSQEFASTSECDYDDSCEEETAISSDHALVLSCSWQTMKVCCLVSSMCASRWTATISQAQMEKILRSIIIRVLTGTRHKGAMEAARSCYSQLSILLLSPNSKFRHLICQQVDDILDQLKCGAQTSITRRAAGMAMMVQVACGAVPRSNKSLIDNTVTTLMDITNADYEEQSTVDSPPVLALHILHSLVLHASLAHHLGHHMPSITIICLKAFTSNSWAKRNAALQLYGAVVPRMVGQKKVRDDSSSVNSLTAAEFLSRHTELAGHLLEMLQNVKLEENNEKDIKTESDYNEELKENDGLITKPTEIIDKENSLSLNKYSHIVPVLSLLARLSPGTGLQQSQELVEKLREYYLESLYLLGSPIHTVRRLTSVSLVALTPAERIVETIGSLIDSIISKLTPNELHGHLLTIQGFLNTYPDSRDDLLKDSLISALKPLLQSSRKTYVNSIVALDILRMFDVDFKFCIPVINSQEPGAPLFEQTWNELELKQLQSTEEIYNFLVTNIFSRHMQEEDFLIFLEEYFKDCSDMLLMENIEKYLWHKLEDIEGTSLSVSLVRILCVILKKQDGITGIPSEKCVQNLLSLLRGCYGIKSSSRTLMVIAYLIKEMNRKDWVGLSNFQTEVIGEFHSVISAHSKPSSNEDRRLAASVSLEICIEVLFTESLTEELIVAICELLQDEDPEIRDTTSKVITSLPTKQLDNSSFQNIHQVKLMDQIVHPNLALRIFIEYVVKVSIYRQDWMTLKKMFKRIYLEIECENTTKKLSLFQSQAINLYKEPTQFGSIIKDILEKHLKDLNENKEALVLEWLQELEVLNRTGALIVSQMEKCDDLLNDKRLLTSVSTYVIASKCFVSICEILDTQILSYPILWEDREFLELKL